MINELRLFSKYINGFSTDSPIFNVVINANVTGTIGLGNRIQLAQSGANKFLLVHGVSITGSSTYLNLYGGTDYGLVSGSIVSPQYSQLKAPFGFPLSPSKWTVEVINSSDCTKTSPTASTWYGGTGLTPTGPSIDVPIGVWRVRYKAVVRDTFTTAAAGNVGLRATLSTANNSESDSQMSNVQTVAVGIVASNGVNQYTPAIEKILTLASKTTYYLNVLASNVTTGDVIGFIGSLSNSLLQAISVYL